MPLFPAHERNRPGESRFPGFQQSANLGVQVCFMCPIAVMAIRLVCEANDNSTVLIGPDAVIHDCTHVRATATLAMARKLAFFRLLLFRGASARAWHSSGSVPAPAVTSASPPALQRGHRHPCPQKKIRFGEGRKIRTPNTNSFPNPWCRLPTRRNGTKPHVGLQPPGHGTGSTKTYSKLTGLQQELIQILARNEG